MPATWIKFHVPVGGVAFACEMELDAQGTPRKFRTCCHSPLTPQTWPHFEEVMRAVRLTNQLLAVTLFEWDGLAMFTAGSDAIAALIEAAENRRKELCAQDGAP